MARTGPLPERQAMVDVARRVARSLAMLARGHVHQPEEYVGRVIAFADGSTGGVYRETRVDRPATDPCVLVVAFRLRAVRGRGHKAFEWETAQHPALRGPRGSSRSCGSPTTTTACTAGCTSGTDRRPRVPPRDAGVRRPPAARRPPARPAGRVRRTPRAAPQPHRPAGSARAPRPRRGRPRRPSAGDRVTVHRLTDRPGRGILAVRPDGHVGFRGGEADPAQLGAWLDLVGAR